MKKLKSTLFAFLFIAWTSSALLGCASKKIEVSQSRIDREELYNEEKTRLERTKQISPGFGLRIKHSADTEISGDYRVAQNGLLKLPYKVNIRAAGITTDELADRLERAYSSYFKGNNSVSVEVISREYNIEVRGLVQKPGAYSVKLDASIEEIIAMAGGLSGPGGNDKGSSSSPTKSDWVRIVRPEFMSQSGKQAVHWIRLSDYFARYDISNEILWRGGEQLFFQMTGDADALKRQSTTIQVLGEVHKPGEYPLSSGMDLYSYIALAGGPTSTADLSKITIIRKEPNTATVYDLTDQTKFIDFSPGDLLLVRSTNTKQTLIERAAPVALSITSIFTSIFLILILF
jgi:protein involved in polysaccharide export with SLBB domain